jgi:hypothetical protein
MTKIVASLDNYIALLNMIKELYPNATITHDSDININVEVEHQITNICIRGYLHDGGMDSVDEY